MKHLSYRQFKNIFGDLGVTYWAKYNWLSNGLPDGEYNGIKKVTLNPDDFTTSDYTMAVNSSLSSNLIAPPNNSTKWTYGFSNWEIEERTPVNPQPFRLEISSAGTIWVRFSAMNLTFSAFKEYIREYPIIIYYYDRSEWGGEILTSGGGRYSTSLKIFYLPSSFYNREIRVIGGRYESLPSAYSSQLSTMGDLTAFNYKGESSKYVYFRDTAFNEYNDWLAKNAPISVVYRTISTQVMSLQSEDETMTASSNDDIVVI